MTTGYDAGTATAKYVLQADAALKVQLQLIKNYQALAKASGFKPPSVSAAPLQQQSAALAKAALAAQKLATEQQKTATSANAAATSAQKLTTEQQRTATALVNTARAEQQLARDTANATAAQDRAAQAALRRQQAEARAARQGQNGGLGPALPRTFAGITSGGFGQLAGLTGGAFSINAAVDAGRQALALRETQNGLRAVAGSTDNYTKILKVAREQQELFGGTLQENIEGLTGLSITSRQSGAQLETLIDLSQRLAVLDPVQGAQGARIALSEALSGDPTSLAKRYEIPRAALAKLRDESTTAGEKLLIIDQYLNKVGISSAAVAGRIDQDALAFRRAKAEIEEATLKLGDYLAKVAAIPARGVTELLNTGAVTGDATAGRDQAQAGTVAAATSFEDYARRVREANAQVEAVLAKDPVAALFLRQKVTLEQLNPVQFAYAQNLIATGTASDVAFQKAQALADVSDALTQQTQGQDAAFTALIPKMALVAASSTENASQVLALNSAFLQGAVSADQVNVVLSALIGVQDAATQATFQEERETRALQRSFIDIIPAANAAAAAIAGARGAAGLVPENRHIGGTGNLAPGVAAGIGGGAGATFAKVDAAQRALQDSRDQLALANAKTNAEKIAIFQRQLDRQTTEEGRNRILAQIASLKNSGGGGRATGLGVLDQDAIQKGEDAQAQLAEVNKLLERTNLTEHQRNDLLEKRRKLEQEITAEGEKQARASIDARLGAVQDAQKRLKEADTVAGLQRAIAGGRITGKQKTAAELRIEEIGLEQQKRALDIQKDAKAAGVAIPGSAAQGTAGGPVITPQVPIPNLATLPPVQQSSVVVNISLNVDKSGNVTATAPDPNVTLNILGNAITFRNLSGGA